MNSTLYPFSNDVFANRRRYETDFNTVGDLLHLVHYGRGKPDFDEYVKLLSAIREHERAEMRREKRVGYSLRKAVRGFVWRNTNRIIFAYMSLMVLISAYAVWASTNIVTLVMGLALFCLWFVAMFARFGSE